MTTKKELQPETEKTTPGVLGQAVHDAVKKTGEILGTINAKIEASTLEKERYEQAPVTRDQTVEMIAERLFESAERYEENIIKPKVLEFALYPAKNRMTERSLIMPSVYDLFVEGGQGANGGRRIRPDAIAWLLHNMLVDKIKGVVDETTWPYDFIEGVDEDKRSEKLREINATIERLEADKKAIQDELKSVGGMLPK